MRDRLYVELWVSLASLLRGYTAAHGLNGNRQATVELGDERITVRHGDNWLDLQRDGARVAAMWADGRAEAFELTEAGTLRGVFESGAIEEEAEQEMDMAAEAWARELMA